MGTNYYLKKDVCQHCGRGDAPLHIGKSSYGWRFLFSAVPGPRSFDEWKEALSEGQIVDEYGDPVTKEAFLARVEQTKSGRVDHYEFLDADGYPFVCYEFS